MSNLISSEIDDIQNKIYTIRGLQVMLDRDLAELYGVPVKRVNEQVKRNIKRFPINFRFQLNKKEKDELVAICDHLNSMKYSSTLPYAFTEQGVSMLSAVLKSETAIEVSIKIIESFVKMKKFISQNDLIFRKFELLERKQVQTDNKIEKIFKIIESRSIKPKQGIFFNGEIFDAYIFVSDLIKSAKSSIILIDNFIDETVLTLLDKREKNVSVTIYTKEINRGLKLDLKKHNKQYPPITIKQFKDSHDRFLIIDNKELYHIGASLKDLGKKWFAFSKMDIKTLNILERLEK